MVCCWKGRVSHLASLTRRCDDKASAVGAPQDRFLVPVGRTLVIKLCNTDRGICSPQTTGDDVDGSSITGGLLY